jgi:hypothetical protein
MAHFRKTIFLSLVLAGILTLALKTGAPLAIIGSLFFLASFIFSLAVGAQSFTLSRVPFLFINGFVFFMAIARGSGSVSDGFFLISSFLAIAAVFRSTALFSFLHKKLPNIGQEDYEKFAKNYANARNLIFSFLFLTAFIWYADAFIVYSVLGMPFYLALLAIFFVTLSLTSFFFKINQISAPEKKLPFSPSIYSLIIGLIISQISWIVGFWPFGYLTAAFIITIIYYTVAMILKEYLFSGRIDRASAARELLFAGIIMALIFYFTKWLPL